MSNTTSSGGILKLAPGHYRVFVDLPKSADGLRHRTSRTVRGTPAEARRARATLLADRPCERQPVVTQLSVGDYLASWLASKQGTVAERTWERYESLLRTSIVPALGHIRLDALRAREIASYHAGSRAEESTARKGKKLSPTTIAHRHMVLKAALAQAVRDELIARNPADGVRPPRRERTEFTVLDEAGATRLLTALQGSDISMLVRLALCTGARLGELLALRWADCDLERRTIHVRRTVVEHMRGTGERRWFDFKEPKSGKGRAIEVDSQTAQALASHRVCQQQARLALEDQWAEHDLVFPNLTPLRSVRPGEPIRPSSVSRTFRHRIEKLGLPSLRFHDLRHSHATMLLRQGFPAHLVARRLGHSDVALTLRVYAGVLPGQERDMVDAFAAALSDAPTGMRDGRKAAADEESQHLVALAAVMPLNSEDIPRLARAGARVSASE